MLMRIVLIYNHKVRNNLCSGCAVPTRWFTFLVESRINTRTANFSAEAPMTTTNKLLKLLVGFGLLIATTHLRAQSPADVVYGVRNDLPRPLHNRAGLG